MAELPLPEPEPLLLEPGPLPPEPELPLPEPEPLLPEPDPLLPSSASAWLTKRNSPEVLPRPQSNTARPAKPRPSFTNLRLV